MEIDIPRINYILSQDDIFQSSIDDNFPHDQRWRLGRILVDMGAYISTPNEYCVFIGLPTSNSIVYEVHVAVVKEGRGRDAVKAARKAAIQFFNDNPTIQKLIGFTPVNLRQAIAFSRMVGFKKEGILTKSFLKDGELHDQYISGLSKEEVLRWQQEQR